MAEWSMAAVLKTAVPERVPGVRIPLPPPVSTTWGDLLASAPTWPHTHISGGGRVATWKWAGPLKSRDPAASNLKFAAQGSLRERFRQPVPRPSSMPGTRRRRRRPSGGRCQRVLLQRTTTRVRHCTSVLDAHVGRRSCGRALRRKGRLSTRAQIRGGGSIRVRSLPLAGRSHNACPPAWHRLRWHEQRFAG